MKKHSLSGAVAIAALVCCMHSKTFAQTDWHITGNSGTAAGSNFVGTTDNVPLSFRTNNAVRMRIAANGNIGIGTNSPVQKLDVNGNINIDKGFSLFMDNHKVLRIDSINGNTFLGISAGVKNAATYNTGNGHYALSANTSGGYNTATGAVALFSNTTGSGNVANGTSALIYNTTGSNNTATGGSSLYSNADGSGNVASGAWASYANTSGSYNAALGYGAMYFSTTGSNNAALGTNAMYNNISGNNNTAIGTSALGANYYSWNNTAVGSHAGDYQLNGWNNTFVGADALAAYGDLYNTVALGNAATVTASNQVRIGNYYTSSIGGYTNWTNISDGRVKKNIKENVPGLAFINKLKPVTYNLDLDAADKIVVRPAAKDKDGKLITQQSSQTDINARNAKQQLVYTGFVAQDVEKAAKELNYDFSGVDAAKSDKDLYGLRYTDFIMPLVKAVQELSQKVEKLEAALAEKNTSSVSAVSSTNITVTDASLGQNTPNPFNRNTTISYTLPQSRQGGASAQIIINDQNGKVVKQINISSAGKGVVNVDASALSSGTYSYTLVVDGKRISSKQMILTK
jgi:trimeric autotransporter adhesin